MTQNNEATSSASALLEKSDVVTHASARHQKRARRGERHMMHHLSKYPPYLVDKIPLSLRGRGVSFILLPACLPFAPSKFQEIRKFHEILIAFEQIPEIPKKFREIFVEKCAI